MDFLLCSLFFSGLSPLSLFCSTVLRLVDEVDDSVSSSASLLSEKKNLKVSTNKKYLV